MQNNKSVLALEYMTRELEKGNWTCIPPMGYKKSANYTFKQVRTNDATYGIRYRNVRVYPIIIDKMMCNIVKDIFEFYCVHKYSMVDIQDYILEKYEVRTTRNHIGNVLRNKFYIGIMEVNGKQYPHSYETFISQSQFDWAQEILNERAQKRPPDTYGKNGKYLFRRLVYCGICQTRVMVGDRKKEIYIYYFCALHKKEYGWVPENKILLALMSYIESISPNYDFIGKFAPNIRFRVKLFIDNYKKWFLGSNLEGMRYILMMLFERIYYEEGQTKVIIRAPFNGECYQGFSLKDLESILRIYAPEQLYAEGFQEAAVTTYEKIIKLLLLEPRSINQLVELLDISLMEINDTLFDIQLDGKVEQEGNGLWRLK